MIHYLFYSRISRQIISLSFPVVLGMMSVTAILVTDTAMVGRLGVLELASTGAAGMAYWAISSIFVGASYGVQVLVARRFGEKRYDEISHIVFTSATLVFMLGALFTALIMIFPEMIMRFFTDNPKIRDLGAEYLFFRAIGTIPLFLSFNFRGFFDGIGKTRIGMSASLVVSFFNILLNYLLIFGIGPIPALGVKGAAIASSISVFLGLFIYLFTLINHKFSYIFDKGKLKFRKDILKDIFSLGLSPSMSEGIQNFGFLVFVKIAGSLGTVSLAVTNVLFSILSISFMPGFAFSIAATTVVGQNLGRGKIRLAEAGAFRSSIFGISLMGMMGLAFIIGGKDFIGLFTREQKVIEAAYWPLVILSITQVADGSHMVFSGALRGAGLVNWVMVTYAIVTWFVMLPMAYFFAILLNWQSNGLWLSLSIWMVFLAAITFSKFKKGTWKSRKF